MSAGTATEDHPADDTEDEQTIEDRVEELETKLLDALDEAEAAKMVAKRAQRQVSDLRDELEASREEVRELETEVERVEDRTNLLQAVQDASSMEVEQRAAVVIQTAVNEAERNGGAAYLTAKEGLSALGGGIDRTSVYDVFERAETLVDDDDVVYYKKESRGSNPPSRLVVDLDAGDVPSMIAGHEIETGGE